MQRIILCAAIVFAANLPSLAQKKPNAYSPKVGETHADFVLPNIETGKPVSLSDYRGKKVLLIHFASW